MPRIELSAGDCFNRFCTSVCHKGGGDEGKHEKQDEPRFFRHLAAETPFNKEKRNCTENRSCPSADNPHYNGENVRRKGISSVFALRKTGKRA